MRVAVYQMDDQRWEMVWTHHHVVLDGWSSVTVIDDLWAHYAHAELPMPPPRFHDFVSGLAAWRDTHEAADIEFWTGTAATGCPPTLLSADRLRQCATAPWSELFLELDRDRMAAWLRGARRLEVSLSTLVHGAWALALAADGPRHEKVGFDVVCSARDLVPAARDAVGMCVASVPLNVPVNPQRSCSAWLTGIARDRATAESHCGAGPDMRRWAAGELSGPPKQGYALAVEGYQQGSLGGSTTIGGLTVRYQGVREATTFAVAGGLPVGEPPQLKVSFDLRRIAADDARELLGKWAQAADLLVNDASRSIGDVLAAIAPLSPRLTSTDDTLTSLWASQVRSGRDRVAVVAPDHTWTYRQLDAAAEAIAAHVRELRLGPEARVGIYGDRSALLVAAILGVLKAGAAYVPLDPRYPLEHRRMIVLDAGISVVITAGDNLPPVMAGVQTLNAASALADPLTDMTTARAVAPEGSPISSRSLCYVLYTSGTSGRPKGVLVEHGNVVRLIRAGQERLGLAPDDVWTMFHSTAFDFSVWEMWGALALGGCLVIVPADQLTSPAELLNLIERERVTVLNQTPTVFRQLLDCAIEEGRPLRAPLRLIVLGGEEIAKVDLRAWFSRPDDELPTLVNMYGITETTVHVTSSVIRREDVDGNGITHVIGTPLPGWSAVVVGEDGCPVPDNAYGELLVGGDCLARGYAGQPGATARRFKPDPNGAQGSREYRTGDRVRRRADGTLEFGGRIDEQLKIRGVRIEPSEVEAALARCTSVRERVVVAQRFSAGDDRLVAYVTVADPAVTGGEIRQQVSTLLPTGMVPSVVHVVDRLPVTPTGKVDRRALLASPAAVPGSQEPVPGQPRGADAGSGPARAQAVVRAIWQELLALPAAPLDTAFFDAGGHSLLMFPMLTALRNAGFSDVKMTDLFTYTTVRALAAHLSETAETTAPGPDAPGHGDRSTSLYRLRQRRAQS
jgi:amino acid adenylation domain-containing protein